MQVADRAQCSLLTAQSSHMATKLKAMESKLLAAAYTQENVSAMECIAGHLDEDMHQLKCRDQRVRPWHHSSFQQLTHAVHGKMLMCAALHLPTLVGCCS